MKRPRARRLTWDCRQERWRGSLTIQGKRRWFAYQPEAGTGKTRSEHAAYEAFKRWLAQWELARESQDQQRWRVVEANLLSIMAEIRRANQDTPADREQWRWAAERLRYVQRMITEDQPCPLGLSTLLAAQPHEGPMPTDLRPIPVGFRAQIHGISIRRTDAAVAGMTDTEIVVPATHDEIRSVVPVELPVQGPPPWSTAAPDVPDAPMTLADAIGAWLRDMKSRVTPARMEWLEAASRRLVNSLGGIPLGEIGSRELAAYRQSVLGEDLMDSRKHALVGVVKQLFRWLVDHEFIDAIPKLLNSRAWGHPAGPPPEVRVLSIDELRRLFQVSRPRDRLAWLLCLNCGFTKADLGSLRTEQVQGEYLVHRRVKTGKQASTPTVRYRLWQEVIDLMAANPGKDGLVLSGALGGVGDAWLSLAWKRRRLKAGLGAVEMRLLRKTGASMLASSPEHRGYVEHYLGHAGRSIADRHYVAVDQGGFDAAISWLGTQLRPAWGP